MACVEETHTDENIETAEPYPGAVETVSAWHEQGHWIHVTSHRAGPTRGATERWLERIGMPYDDLHCSYDKISRCVELGMDVLVDDSPVNLERALEAGIAAATIVHPGTRSWSGLVAPSAAATGSSCASGSNRSCRADASIPATIGGMAETARTSLRVREPEVPELGARAGLPARREDDLRSYLPGVEPERQLNDWGRSERVEGFLDRTVIDFFYRYWFRCEVEGIENVPPTGAPSSSPTTRGRSRRTPR